MNHTRLWTAATIIGIIVLLGFALSVPHTNDSEEILAVQSETTVPVVTVRDTFKKGLHTITGSVEAPNACTSVSAEASLSGEASSAESILITLIMPTDEGICLQTPVRATFETTISAPAELPLVVIINGAVATTSAP